MTVFEFILEKGRGHIAVALTLASLQIPAYADLGTPFIGEIKLTTNPRCFGPALSPAQVYQYTESNALQSCGGLDVQRINDQIHNADVCEFGQGGAQFRQVLYTCVPNDNPDALFDEGPKLLSSESSQRRFGLIYLQSSCIDFDILGLSYGESLPNSQLQQLADELLVQESLSGVIKPMSGEILLKDRRPALRYKRTNVGLRSGGLLIESRPGKSINDVMASTLGKSNRTGYEYKIRVTPVMCI